MFKTATDRAEDLLNAPPAREENSVKEWVNGLKQAKRDLYAELNDPRTRMGDRNVVKISTALQEVEMKLPQAEAILDRIRNEIPNQEFVEASQNDTMLDVQASVEKLAVAYAAQTIGEPSLSRLAGGITAFEQHLEPNLPIEGRDWVKGAYYERLTELVAMPSAKLAETAQKEFPTDEWIGKPSEPVGGEGDLGYIPTHFEKDETTAPEKDDVDGNFSDAIEKERKFRGITKVEDDQKKALPGIKEEKTSAVTADAVNSTPGSHEPAQEADGGAQMKAKPPEPEEAFENQMLEDGGRSSAPVGPNRRRQKDVPAYSTPSNKLTAAQKLAMAQDLVGKFENMTPQQALAIVTAATDDEEVDATEDEAPEVEKKEASLNEEVSLEGLFDV